MSTENSNILDILDGNVPVQAPPAPTTPQEPQTPPETAPKTPVTPPVQAPPVEPVTPPTDTPPTDTVPPATPAAPSIGEELVKITGGAIKTPEQLAELLQKQQTYTELESRVKEIETENLSLKAKAEADPFASEYFKKLNQLAKDGATQEQINAFTKVNAAGDLDKIDAIEVKVLALQLKDGLTEQEARNYVARNFKLNPEEYTEQEVADAKIDLKLSSRADRDYLKTHKTEVETSPAVQQERQAQLQAQQRQQHIEKVLPVANEVVAQAKDLFKGISINGKNDDTAIKVDFTPTDASLSSLPKVVGDMVAQMGESLPATQEGREQIGAFVKNVLIQQNYQNWIVEAASQREKQVRAEYHNPTPINRGQDNPNPGKASVDEVSQRLLDLYN